HPVNIRLVRLGALVSGLGLVAVAGVAPSTGAALQAAEAAQSTATVANTATSARPYLVGRGIADVTGEVAEVGMMGYADLGQTGEGLHMRQRARAFVIAERAS